MSAPLSSPAGSSRDRTWNALHTAAVETLPGAFRLMGVAEADIDDLLQEVLLATYRTLDRFDPTWPPPWSEAGEPGEPARRHARRQHRSAEERWVFGIAWRKVSHYLGRAYRRREVPHGLLPASCSEAVDPAPQSEQRAVERERLELVIDVLWTLDPERRLLLVLHEAYEVPLVEIARELGINDNTATNRLRLAREDYRAAVKRLRPEQRDALRGCWLGLPLASELLVREEAGALAPASRETRPPAAPAEPALPAPSPQPAPSPPASSPPALSPPALSPTVPAPRGTERVRPWLGELGRALGWSAAGAGAALALLLALAPPRPLWADRFGPRMTALSAGDTATALRHIALHEQRFPSGRLRSVRERLRELAQARLARSAEGPAKEEPSR